MGKSSEAEELTGQSLFSTPTPAIDDDVIMWHSFTVFFIVHGRVSFVFFGSLLFRFLTIDIASQQHQCQCQCSRRWPGTAATNSGVFIMFFLTNHLLVCLFRFSTIYIANIHTPHAAPSPHSPHASAWAHFTIYIYIFVLFYLLYVHVYTYT